MKKLFLAVFISLSLGLSSWSSFALEKTATEVYLAMGYEFQIEDKEKIIEQLFLMIASLRTKDKSPEDFLLLGDIYHWLGHIAEDAESREKAEKYYRTSYMFYKETPLTHSPRINNLHGAKHAIYHLSKNAKMALSPEEVRLKERVEFALDISEELAEKVYKFTKEDLKEQADNIDNLCAKHLTNK